MKVRILPVALILCLAPIVSAQGENPFRTAKVGDWVSYKLNTAVGEFTVPGEMKMTVSAKDEKNATIKMDISVMDMKQTQETKIDLTKAYDPTKLAGIGGAGAPQGFKIEKAGDGKETIKVGGKSYDCAWTKLKMNGDAGGMKIDADMKIWMTKTVPLAGMVKMEMKSNVFTMTMEMTGSGSK